MYPIALSARERTHLLLLVGTKEVEAREIRPRIYLALAQLELFLAAETSCQTVFSPTRVSRL